MGGGAEQRELSDRENGEDAERDVRDTADRGARARNGTFEPRIIGKHQSRFTGFDDKIISLYVRELSVREIQQHLEEIYKVEVSPGLISNVTDEVIDEAKAWQDPPPESFYPIVYMDALIFKVRDTGVVRNKAV
jgi:Transposase and inactivated derivatives